MLCALSRWMVSRSEDTGKKLPRMVERHVGRCPACGAFVRASMAVASRLRSERAAYLAQAPDFAVELDAAALRTRPDRRGVEAAPKRSPRFLFGLRPLPVAAAALLLVVAAVIIFRTGRPTPSLNPQDLAAARATIKSLTSAPAELRGVVGEAESSLDKERRVLERSLASAADYLQARLNIKIERKPSSNSI